MGVCLGCVVCGGVHLYRSARIGSWGIGVSCVSGVGDRRQKIVWGGLSGWVGWDNHPTDNHLNNNQIDNHPARASLPPRRSEA